MKLSNGSRLSALLLLAFIGLAFGVVACVVTISPPPTATLQRQNDWLTYTSDDAAYAFDYPPDALISTSDDASLRFKIVYVQFPVTDTDAYQGASILVLENPSNASVRDAVATRYAEAGRELPATTQRAAGLQVNGREAIKLERDEVVGDLDKYSVLVAGNGVIYRINLFGGGVGGPIEPTPQTEALFDRLVQSFRVLDQPLKPKPTPTTEQGAGARPAPTNVAAEPSVASVFTYPLRSGAGLNYGVPTGIVVGGTRMEWLDYAIRNLDQWRIKCYGVDWSRMIHTGEDWYRDDYLTANTAGTPVRAVADGVVARHDPGISYPGNVVVIRHRLPDGRDIYSMYGHVSNVSVTQGQLVSRGQQIATVFNQGYVGRTPNRHPTWDSHLHFEMRYFLDGGNIYVTGTNAYNYNYPSCTYLYPGRGYTYIIHPDQYPYPNSGYTDPSDFIAARLQEPPPGCTPTELIANGGFESGPPGTPWTATNSLNRVDPLIYKSRPHTGRWGGWLGNVLNYTDTLAQVVNVPADSTTATLTFWRYVQSLEPSGNGDDRMVVTLAAPDGGPIGSPFTLTTAARRNVWTKETVSLGLTGYASPTATLSLTGTNDGKNKSSFFVDDVSLIRQCPQASGVRDQGSGVSPAGDVEPVDTQAAEALETQMVLTDTPPLTNAAFLPAVTSEIDPPPVDKDLELQGVCVNLLANGDFESTTSDVWTGIANTSGTIYNVIPNGSSSGLSDPLVYTTRPHTGARSGRVGSPSVNSYWNELLQTVQLPPNTTSMALTYWRYLDTTETSTTTAYDKFTVGLEADEGIEIVTPQRTNNTSSGRGTWVQETLQVPNATAYSNQKIWITFKGTLDSNRPSRLYVDDVQLTVCTAK